MSPTDETPGLVGRVHALVAGTRLEAPGLALARHLRRALFGVGHDAPPAPAPGADDGVPMFVPPGHFYSPVPSVADIEAYRAQAREPRPPSLGAIDLRVDEQSALLDSFRGFYAEQPFPTEQSPETRYWFENHSFSYGDALALHCMLRSVRPKRVVEVGSGWSSCVLLDTCERFLDWEPEVTLIEPYPHQLHLLVRPDDLGRVRLVPEPVQQVSLDEFTVLDRDDILFIDSTHVARVGSDVLHEIFEILPSLQPGVYVHFHDIFYPFDYPVDWVEEGRGWNEAYVLRAFLEYNDAFEIVLWNDLIAQRFGDRLAQDFPLWTRNTGGSLWLRKRGAADGGAAVG
jgi:hypothetical protein